MKRRTLWLLVLASLTLVAAGWLWVRPYQWRISDSPIRIETARLTRDHSYFWLDLHLRAEAGQAVPDPLLLLVPDREAVKPAQIDLEGTPATDASEVAGLGEIHALSVKFWLEESQLAGPLELQAGSARLKVRSRSGVPAMENDESQTFHTHRW